LQHFRHIAASFDGFVARRRPAFVPPPCIIERLNLCSGARTVQLCEQHVVIPCVVEGRIKVRQVH
jgi:hypothetical protein